MGRSVYFSVMGESFKKIYPSDDETDAPKTTAV